MRPDILKTGEENIFALIKGTAGNEGTTVSAANTVLGVATIGTGLPGNHNTTVTITAIDGAGMQSGSSTSVSYMRTSLLENVVNPGTTFMVTDEETTEGLLTIVTDLLGLRKEDVEFTTELDPPLDGDFSEITLRAKVDSYLYVGSQVLLIAWPVGPGSTVSENIPKKTLKGFTVV